MRRLIAFCCLLLLGAAGYGQKAEKQPATFGINFLFQDFASAAAIRASSISTAIRNRQFAQIEKMSPGLALTYTKGLSPRFNIATTVSGSFLSYPIPQRAPRRSESFLLETDISIQGKMLNSNFWINPYLQIGAGASVYSSYWGAYIPAGAGIQLTLFKEAYLFINSQYRIPVTPTTEFHFYYSLGIAGRVGN